MATDLNKNFVLVTLKRSNITNNKKHKAKTAEVCSKEHADEGMVNLSTKLYPKHRVESINKILQESLVYHDKMTKPWSSLRGTGLLKITDYQTYSEKMTKFQEDLKESFNVFRNNWDDILKEAKEKKNGLFDPDNYPDSPESLQVEITYRVSTVPCQDDFVCEIEDAIAHDIKKQIEETNKEQYREVLTGIFEQIASALGKVSEIGEDGKTRFRIERFLNVVEATEELKKYNISNVPRITTAIEKIVGAFSNVDTESLRKNDSMLDAVKNTATELQSEVKAITDELDGYDLF